MIAALFVDERPGGAYVGLPDVEVWGVSRDARKYGGPWPVVAHPPCQLWTNLAELNYQRYGGERNRPGNDGGCFGYALFAVREWGGVLEHPAGSKAWGKHGLPVPPADGGWVDIGSGWQCEGWVCEVWQSAYGHRARKRTWLFAAVRNPPELDWSHPSGTHQCGWFDRVKPTLSKREASATPPAFRDVLISIARTARTRGEK